ncbi:hypothetical protein U9M48_020461 [Paspalum notatum var. saurae]|uniref:Uncharacterized protein n=1 Tax=Paspalum notatum var. saurae TaxID=547442 RepID=A0AAQ3TEC0_PASNO
MPLLRPRPHPFPLPRSNPLSHTLLRTAEAQQLGFRGAAAGGRAGITAGFVSLRADPTALLLPTAARRLVNRVAAPLAPVPLVVPANTVSCSCFGPLWPRGGSLDPSTCHLVPPSSFVPPAASPSQRNLSIPDAACSRNVLIVFVCITMGSQDL